MSLVRKSLAAWMRCACGLAIALCLLPALALATRGTPEQPLRVLLIPADGGTPDGTLADFAPLFEAVSARTGLNFELRVGQSYAAVVQGLQAGVVDIAWLGPVAYAQARALGAAELLAVAVQGGDSVYYAGIFVPRDSPLQRIEDLRGRRLAFGDIHSGSSFTYQAAMLLEAGIDPARELAAVRFTGSHAASLGAVLEGQVDAACLSFESYLRAVDSGVLAADALRVLARSEPIPNPPLALHPQLPDTQKRQLRAAFGGLHEQLAQRPERLVGYGGRPVERYAVDLDEALFDAPARQAARIDAELRAALLARAAQR